MRGLRQQGVAIISVLVVVAIVAGIGAAAVVDQQYVLRRTANLLHGNQATMHLLALESWGLEVLIDDLEQERTEDSLLEDWARELPPVSADGGIVSGRIEDLQGRFNLNSVISGGSVNTYAIDTFTCLLDRYGKAQGARDIASSLVDWIDSDQNVYNNTGAEDLDYLSKDPPYRTASRILTSPSELLLIDGMTIDIYEALQPYITALPVDVKRSAEGEVDQSTINVNTASEELLNCVGGGTDPIGSALLDEIESSGPFTSQEEVHSFIRSFLNIEENFNASQWPLDVKSNYFLQSTRAEFGDLVLLMRHVVQRDEDGARVIMRIFGEQW
jgi:general secretion pathway protein K